MNVLLCTSSHTQVPIVPIVIHEYLGPESFYNSGRKVFKRGGHMHVTVLPAIDSAGYAHHDNACSSRSLTDADSQILLEKTQKAMADFLLSQSPVNAAGFAADEMHKSKKQQ